MPIAAQPLPRRVRQALGEMPAEKNMFVKTVAKLMAGIAGGLLVAFLGVILLPLTFDILPVRNSEGTGVRLLMFFALWAWGIIVAMRSEDAIEVCRALLSASALISLLFPLASLAYRFFFMEAGDTLTVGPDDNEIRAGFVSLLAGILGAVLAAVFYVLARLGTKTPAKATG